MSEPLDQLATQLKQAGFSLTTSRRVVFEALQAIEPQTISELIAHCPKVDRASIYRTILLFERLNIVQRLQIGWKYKLELTGDFMHHHHHLSCVQCGKLSALPEDPALEQRLQVLATSQSFLPSDHQLEIRGLCTACQPNA